MKPHPAGQTWHIRHLNRSMRHEKITWLLSLSGWSMNMDSLTRLSRIYLGPTNRFWENGSANECRIRQLSYPVPGTFVPGTAVLEVSRCEREKKSLMNSPISNFRSYILYNTFFSCSREGAREINARTRALREDPYRTFCFILRTCRKDSRIWFAYLLCPICGGSAFIHSWCLKVALWKNREKNYLGAKSTIIEPN